mmetsp:Transcript_15781/g.32361  ORF Transcript_15781/g.32361 Transcript_15781/m.32361 type:complete len:87 (+) Transcript_15781:478-738(+)
MPLSDTDDVPLNYCQFHMHLKKRSPLFLYRPCAFPTLSTKNALDVLSVMQDLSSDLLRLLTKLNLFLLGGFKGLRKAEASVKSYNS